MTQKKNKNAKGEARTNEDFYTRLVISKNRRFGLGVILSIYFIAFTSIIQLDLILHKPWITIAIPLIVSGTFIIFFPPTEEWEYKPWQNNKEKQETMFFN